MQLGIKSTLARGNTKMQKSIHSFDGRGPGQTACVVNGVGVVNGGSPERTHLTAWYDPGQVLSEPWL